MKSVSKCMVCNKKLGLTPFKCKCERDFCSIHRAPEDHSCTYDFKSNFKTDLHKNMPICISDKLNTRI